MKTRQANVAAVVFAACLALWGCATRDPATPLPTVPSPTRTQSPTPTTVPASPTPAVSRCASLPGTLGRETLMTTAPPQEYIIYLPPCYFESTGERYPVLYLLHGQTYTDDQWIRMGTTDIADALIVSGAAKPFIIVFPDDRFWNLEAGPGFGERLLALIPHIDARYRTLADREHRALGGLSRGGGWTARLGFTHPELFGSLGLHSPAIFKEDGPYLRGWIAAIDNEERPRLWLDIGDNDTQRLFGDELSEFLAEIDYPHEFHLYGGGHSEDYWAPHVEEYLRWYIVGWTDAGPDS